MKNDFRNKDGSLSRYAFLCGHIEIKQVKDLQIQLYQDSVWHVKGFIGNKRFIWETFDLLTQARAFIRKLARS